MKIKESALKQLRNYIKEIIDHVFSEEKRSDVENSLIKESSLSRLWHHIENRMPFAMVSLSRNTMSPAEKQDAFIKLKQTVRNMGYGFVELKGGYVEKSGNNSNPIDVVNELSLMVPNISKEDVIKIGQMDLGHGPQDTILYSDGKEFLGYLITNKNYGTIGNVDFEFDYGKGKNALPMGKEAVKQYFSMLAKGSHKGRKFAFVPKLIDENFYVYEMRDRRYPKNPEKDWWNNFGFRIL